MAKKPKVKVNLNKPAKRPIVNIQYFRVYNEVLKFEEVMDIDLDIIAEVVIDVMTDAAMESKLGDEPTESQIEALVSKIVDELITPVKLEDLVSQDWLVMKEVEAA